MRRWGRVSTTAAVVLACALPSGTATGAGSLPHQYSQFGLDAGVIGPLSGVTGLVPDHPGGAAVPDAVGGHHLALAGDELATIAAARALLVDNAGPGYAAFAGDSALHVLAPDGHELRS